RRLAARRTPDDPKQAIERNAPDGTRADDGAVDPALGDDRAGARMRPERELAHPERRRLRRAVFPTREEQQLALPDPTLGRARDPERAVREPSCGFNERHVAAYAALVLGLDVDRDERVDAALGVPHGLDRPDRADDDRVSRAGEPPLVDVDERRRGARSHAQEQREEGECAPGRRGHSGCAARALCPCATRMPPRADSAGGLDSTAWGRTDPAEIYRAEHPCPRPPIR